MEEFNEQAAFNELLGLAQEMLTDIKNKYEQSETKRLELEEELGNLREEIKKLNGKIDESTSTNQKLAAALKNEQQISAAVRNELSALRKKVSEVQRYLAG